MMDVHKASMKLGLILGKVEMTKLAFERTNYTFNSTTRDSLIASFNDIQDSILAFAGEFLAE